MNKSQISEIFEVLKKQNPTPKTELNYTNDFTLLVAIALSAQSTDVAVNKATKPLFEFIKTPQDLINLGENEFKKHIKTIGLYNSKAKNILKMCEILMEKHNGNVPTHFDDLIVLPSVGSKTAKVFLNCYYQIPVIAADTHVHRVSNRLGFCNTKTPLQTENKLNKIVPDEYKLYAHHWLILLGRYVCKARKPECDKCELTDKCKFYKKA